MASTAGADNVSLLFIVGSDDPDGVVSLGSKIKVSGSSDLTKLLLNREPYHRLHVTRNLLRKARRPELDQYSCILNLITEAERSPKSLETLQKLLRGFQGKVVNRPEAVLHSTRDQVARQMEGIDGLRSPATVRLPAGKSDRIAQTIERAGIKPPIILRQAGTHGGKILGLFETIESVAAAVEPGVDHLATEFVDFQSADGLYRKYRVFFIGPEMVLRHKLISDDWNIHARDRSRFMAERPDLVSEERELFVQHGSSFPPHVHTVLKAVRQKHPLDYFGMDFGITAEGDAVLFEANATMNFFPFSRDPQFQYLQLCFRPAQRAFRRLLGLPEEEAAAPMFRWSKQPA